MRFKKKLRKTYKKVKRFIKKYIRFLIRHTRARDYSVLFYTIVGLIGIILIISLLVNLIAGIFKKDDSDKKKPNTEQRIEEQIDDSNDAALRAEAQAIYDANKEFLLLVNYDNPLDASHSFNHHTLNCGLDIDARIYGDLYNMLYDLNQEDLHYSIVSAYRSREEQLDIINQNVLTNMEQGMSEEEAYEETYKTVQHVGTSEHESGLALDITSEGVFTLTESVEEYPTNIWLKEHCYEYGFILRYPKDKEDITGITYEPWHFRYVGVEAATFITENNLTLEEFYELLDLSESGTALPTDTTTESDNTTTDTLQDTAQ